MTGEEIIKAAELIDKLRRLHRVQARILKPGIGVCEIASTIATYQELETCVDAGCVALRSVVERGIARCIEEVGAEMTALGVIAPFPTFEGKDLL